MTPDTLKHNSKCSAPSLASSKKKNKWVLPQDCRRAMLDIKENSVSLILTDPPYFIDGMGEDWDHNALKKRAEASGVVKSLPVGMKFDKNQGLHLQAFLYPIAREWLRIIRPGGFALCFSQNRLVHHTAMAMEEAGFEIRDMLAWRYEGQAKAFSQEHFVRRRNISESEKCRLIKKMGVGRPLNSSPNVK